MKYTLPVIFGAGLFDSENKFPKITVTPPRRVQTYELEYFFESGGVSVVNGVEHPVKSGNLLFAKPGDMRYSRLPLRCKFLHFSVDDPELKAAADSIPRFPVTEDLKRIDTAFSDIAALFCSVKPLDNIAAAARLVTLLHFLSDCHTEELSLVTLAQRFIENNYRDDITTETIAAACCVSVSYLHKLFKTALNTTPGDFLLNCRIAAAKQLLIDTTFPLSTIAFDCGFNSQSYFSDCFKRKNGISPGTFRKNAAYLP